MSDYFVRKTNRIPFAELYQKGNGYFVTICVQDRQCIFDDKNDEGFSKIVIREWQNIVNFYDNVIVDEFILMPNHFHAIIIFDGIPKNKSNEKDVNLSIIISTFKSISYKKIKRAVEESPAFHSLDNQNQPFFQKGNVGVEGNGNVVKNGNVGVAATLIQNYNSIWQKSYYDHIIRNEEDLDRIRKYIVENPTKWELDELNPLNNP